MADIGKEKLKDGPQLIYESFCVRSWHHVMLHKKKAGWNGHDDGCFLDWILRYGPQKLMWCIFWDSKEHWTCNICYRVSNDTLPVSIMPISQVNAFVSYFFSTDTVFDNGCWQLGVMRNCSIALPVGGKMIPVSLCCQRSGTIALKHNPLGGRHRCHDNQQSQGVA